MTEPGKLASPLAPRTIAWLAMVVLLALLIGNVSTFTKNFRVTPQTAPITSSHDLVAAAEANNHYKINAGAALYYLLEMRIRGATLTIPPQLRKHRDRLQRVSQLTVVDARLARLPARATRQLEKRVSHRGRVYRNRREIDAIHYVFVKGATRYVIVPTANPEIQWMLLPENEYRALVPSVMLEK